MEIGPETTWNEVDVEIFGGLGLEILSGGPLSPYLPPHALTGPGPGTEILGPAAHIPNEFDQETIDKLIEQFRRANSGVDPNGVGAIPPADLVEELEAWSLVLSTPPIFIDDGSFNKPPDRWAQLEVYRRNIETVIRSTGRVELHWANPERHVGTGFMLSEALFMTCAHVARTFVAGTAMEITAVAKPVVDFNEERHAEGPMQHAVESVLFLDDELDVAVLQLSGEGSAGHTLPPPLELGYEADLASDSEVYVVGYPGSVGAESEEHAVAILATQLGTKRLSPGLILGSESGFIEHTCFTLTGSSGSPLLSLGSTQVAGLHRQGFYDDKNYAVPVAPIRDLLDGLFDS